MLILLSDYIRIYTLINPTNIFIFLILTEKENKMKPIIFLNRFEEGDDELVKLIIKDSDNALKERLANRYVSNIKSQGDLLDI